MRKEGTGKPRHPDITLDADVRMRELHFEEVPDPEVRFRGSTKRNSVWGSRRENLPDEVQEGVVYRNAGVQLRVASEIVDSEPDSLHSFNEKREETDLEYRSKWTGQQETKGKEEEK